MTMKVLTCFQVIPDLDKLLRSDWVVDSHFSVDTSFVPKIINPYDESAIELVLKLTDQWSAQNQEDFHKLTAFTIGDEHSDRYLKNMYALNYHQTVRVDNQNQIRFNSEAISDLIEKYITEIEDQDFIVMGRQSGIGDNGKTPLLLAEKLNIPCITNVIKLEASDDNCIKVTSLNDEQIIEQIISGPAVISIGDVQKSYLRVPTLKDKLAAKKKQIHILEITDLLSQDQVTDCHQSLELIDLYREQNSREGIRIDKETSKEIVKELYQDYLKERLK